MSIVAFASSLRPSVTGARIMALLAKRHALYEVAKAKNPERWSGSTRNWTPVGAVNLNPQWQDKKAA